MPTINVGSISEIQTQIANISNNMQADDLVLEITGDLTASSGDFSTGPDNHETLFAVGLEDSDTLTIRSAGSNTFRIDADQFGRIFDITNGTVVLRDLVLTGGLLSGDGGTAGGNDGQHALGAAIRNASDEDLTLDSLELFGNHATGGGGASGYGGGGGSGVYGTGGGYGGAIPPDSGEPPSNGDGGDGAYGGTSNIGLSGDGGADGILNGGGSGGGSSSIYAGGAGGSVYVPETFGLGGGGGAAGSTSDPAGDGGDAAGAIFNAAGATLKIAQSSFSSNGAAGGGGAGAISDPAGNGGDAGGALFNEGNAYLDFVSSSEASYTFNYNAGSGGYGGDASFGTDGANGSGSAIYGGYAAFGGIVDQITSSTADGTFGPGDTIDVTVRFSDEATLSGGNLIVDLDTGVSLQITTLSGQTAVTATYTVGSGSSETSSDLTVTDLRLASMAKLQDADGDDFDLSLPAGDNLSDNEDLVVAQPTAPQAQDDSASTAEDTAVTIDVIANDTDPLEETLSLESIVGAPANGTVTITASEELRYDPEPDFNGTDSFTYRVTNPSEEMATASVDVTVDPVNDPPSFDLTQSSLTAFNDATTRVISNFATNISVGPSNEVSDEQSIEDYLVSNDNTVLFASQPDISNAGDLVFQARDGVSGTASVSVRLRDDGGTANGGQDTSSAQSFSVQVDNRVPLITDAAVNADTLTVSFDENLDAESVPATDAFDVTADGASLAVTGVAIDGSTVSLGLEPSVASGDPVSLDYTPGDTPLTDRAGNPVAGFSRSATNETPQPAPDATDDILAVDEGEVTANLVADLLGNDANAAEIVAVDTSETVGEVQFDAAAGDLVYTASGFSLGAGQTASDQFLYIAGGDGGTDQAVVTVTVTGVNDSPAAADDAVGLNLAASARAAGDVLANDGDPDDGDTLAVSAVAGAAGNVGETLVLDSGAELTLGTDGAFDYAAGDAFTALAQGETAEDSVSYTVADGNGGTAQATLTVTVTGANDPPVAANDTARLDLREGASTRIDARANDTDPDDGDGLRVTAVSGTAIAPGESVALASGAEVALAPDGALVLRAGDAFAGLPAGASAVERFSYTVSDRAGATAGARVGVTVTGANDAPVARDDAVERGPGQSVVTGNLLANDGDPDDGDSPRVAAFGQAGRAPGETLELDSGARLTVSADGRFTYDPDGAFADLGGGEMASDRVPYTVVDGEGGRATATLTVTSLGAGFDDDLVFGGSAVATRPGNTGRDFDIRDAPDAADVVDGGPGADLIGGGGGDDELAGGPGSDVLHGEDGADRLAGGADGDRLFGGPGPDTLIGGTGNDKLEGGGGADELAGGPGVDALQGGAGDDRLVGGPGNDVLVGGAGADRLVAGDGVDGLIGGPGGDTFVFRPYQARNFIADFDVGTDTLRLIGFDGLDAGAVADMERAVPRGLEITLTGTTLVLNNVAPGALGPDDLAFG